MKGVKPHDKTGILWLRLRTPASLIARRTELEALGVAFKVEHHRSLETRDPRKAAKVHAEKRLEIEAIWDAWEALLKDGPKRLSHKNIMALAGEQAQKFLAAHEDEPFDAPTSDATPELRDDGGAFTGVVERMAPEDREALKADLIRYLRADDAERAATRPGLLARHPALRSAVSQDVGATFETQQGPASDRALDSKGLHVDPQTRRLLNLELAGLMAAARGGLEQRKEGDWGAVPGLHALPTFDPLAASSAGGGSWRSATSEPTFETVIAEQERLSGLRLDKQYRSARTFTKYREDCTRFCEWRNSKTLTTTSVREVAKWRDEMIALSEKGGMRRKTIILRVTALSAVIGWAMAHNRRQRADDSTVPELFPEGNPLRGIDLPAKQKIESEERTLTKEMARTILLASRSEEEPSRRWSQWLLTYSGMRIGEVAQLEKRDVMDYEGFWYLMIRSDDDRTTKTNQSRRIPIHKAVIAEGFLEFVRKAPVGRLFPAKRMTWIVRKWVHKVLEPHGGFGGKPPLHSSRHLFGDMATGKMDLAARYYIEGRALPGSGKDYGRSAAMIPELSRMVDDIEPLLPMPEIVQPGGVT